MKAQAQQLQHDLAKIMRRFGRQCRGQSKVFVSLVRQTETQLLTNGSPVVGIRVNLTTCANFRFPPGRTLPASS